MSQGGLLKVNNNILPPDVPTTFITDSGTATPSGHLLYILGGTGVSTSAPGDSDTIVINVTGTGFTWQVVTSADNPVTLTAENGYIAKGVSPVNFVLPASASVGDNYWIKGYGNLWTLSQNAFQTVSLGIVTTLAGVGGSVTASQVKDSLKILCVSANTEFEVIDSIGNPTFV